MVSDAAFLNEVDGFLASCELPYFRRLKSSVKLTVICPQKDADGEKTTTKKQNSSKDKSYYRRRKEERLNLRRQVTELAAELKQLQQNEEGNKSPPPSEWKALAKYQAKERANVEFEQRQLSAAIATQAAQLLGFFKLAQAQLSQLAMTEQEIRLVNRASSGPFKRIRVDPPLDSKAEFYLSELYGAIDKSSGGGESDTEDLDGVHAQTDDCLRAYDEFSPAKMWEEKDSGCFQYAERYELCCDLEQACQTFWDASKLRHRQEGRQEFHQVPDPENMLAFNFRVSNRLSSGQVVSFIERAVARRYRTKDRQVFVWQSYMTGEEMFTGLRAGETGWDILTRSVDASGQEKVT